MSVIGLVNLAERLSNQNTAQGPDAEATPKAANPQSTQGNPGTAEDQFTPSAQSTQAQATAQAAGLFSVSHLSIFSAAANFLLGQNPLPQSSQPAAATPPATANASAQQPAAANTQSTQPAVPTAASPAALLQPPADSNNATTAANPVSSQTAANAPVLSATTAAVSAPVTTTTGAATSTEQQLQALNAALQALGLSPQDIQQLDQIATVINEFNPAAFTALAYQLEALAPQTAPQTASTTEANTQNTLASTNAAAANTTPTEASNGNGTPTAPNSGGFQIQELVIKFTGVNAQGTTQNNGSANSGAQGTTGNANGNGQVSAFNLQIEEVNLTLVNGSGQTTQLQAPAQTTNTAGTAANQGAANAKAQGASA